LDESIIRIWCLRVHRAWVGCCSDRNLHGCGRSNGIVRIVVPSGLVQILGFISGAKGLFHTSAGRSPETGVEQAQLGFLQSVLLDKGGTDEQSQIHIDEVELSVVDFGRLVEAPLQRNYFVQLVFTFQGHHRSRHPRKGPVDPHLIQGSSRDYLKIAGGVESDFDRVPGCVPLTGCRKTDRAGL